MVITEVKYYPVKIRSNAKGGVYWFLLKIETDEGIGGWGEIIWNAYSPSTLGEMVKDIAQNYFIGECPFNIEKIFQKAFFKLCKCHTDLATQGILSGFEIALWDIIGKKCGQPIYNLMGGIVNERIRAYTYLYEKNDRIFCEDFWTMSEECAKRAKEYVDMGFTAVKLDPFAPYLDDYATHIPRRESIERAVKTIRLIREAVGENVDILIGTHGQFTGAGAVMVAEAIAPYHPLWFEEPTPPENYPVLTKVSREIRVPIATGERLATKFEFASLINQKCCDIYQLDISGCGGILEAKKIAAMAEANHTMITTHFWAGPVNFAAQLNLAACCPNFLIQEAIETMNGGFCGFEKIMDDSFVFDRGYFIPPKKPGLGIEINEDKVKQYLISSYDDTNILI